jgi:hypothetical protein
VEAAILRHFARIHYFLSRNIFATDRTGETCTSSIVTMPSRTDAHTVVVQSVIPFRFHDVKASSQTSLGEQVLSEILKSELSWIVLRSFVYPCLRLS